MELVSGSTCDSEECATVFLSSCVGGGRPERTRQTPEDRDARSTWSPALPSCCISQLGDSNDFPE